MDFLNMDISTIATGIDCNGVRYLQSFLKEYTSIFQETVNPGCNKCLNTYINKYKAHFMKNKNTSGYVLHLKYENIPLEFGSPVLVNNGNITDEYAKKLLEHPDGERYFATIPDVSKDDNHDEGAKLQKAFDVAQDKVNGLPVDAHHKKKEAADKALAKAKAALDEYNANQAAKANEFEVVLTNDDVNANPELSESGLNAGDTVVIDKKEYENNGTLSVIAKIE